MHLLTQLWFYLVLASALGFLIGWLVYKTCIHRGLVKQLSDRDEDLVQVRSELDRLGVTAHQYQADWRSAAAFLETRETELAHANRLLESTRVEVKESKVTLTEALTSIDATTGELRGARHELAELERIRRTFESECNALKSDLGTARAKATETRGHLTQKTNDLSRAEDEATRMREELDSQKDRLLNLTREIETVQEESSQFKADWKSTAARLALRDDELKDSHAGLAVRDRHLKEALALAEHRSRELADTLSATRERQTNAGQTNAGQTRTGPTNAELRELQVSLDSLQKEHEPCAARMASLRLELEASRGKHERTREEVAEIRSAHENCAPMLSDLQAELSQVKSQVDARTHERDAALAKATQFADDWTEAFALLESRNKELARVEAEKETVSGRAQEFEGELATCRAQARTARTEWEKVVSGLEAKMVALRRRTLPSNASFTPARTTQMSRAELESAVLAAGKGRPPQRIFAQHDDLKAIGGVGPQNETWLQEQGIYYFWQIAGWGPEEAAWVASGLPTFGGRVYRENWMNQAMKLARGIAPEPKAPESRGDYQSGNHV